MPRADWGQYSQGSALSHSHPCPQVPSPCVPPMPSTTFCPLPLPTSHSGIPNPTQTPASHRPSWLVSHIAGGAEVALGVHGWEDKVGGHCLPACQHPQQQEAGTLQQQPPQLGPAVAEALALWLCLQKDLATSWDSHRSSIPRDRAWGTPGETGQLCCPLPGCDPALSLTSPSCRVFMTVIPCWSLTMWVLFSVGCGLSCGRGGRHGVEGRARAPLL